MKKVKSLNVIGLICFITVLIFLLMLIFLKQIKVEILLFISSYGYIAILLMTIIVDILVLPIGPEISLISGKIAGLNFIFVAFATVIGTTVASVFNYKVGRLIYQRVGNNRKISEYISLYQKYGGYALFIAAVGPVPYVPLCWISGSYGLPVGKFFYFGVIPRIVRISLVSLIMILFF